MPASHDYRLVLLSILISVLGAYAARSLAERLRYSRGRGWLGWLAGGAVADGVGTWSMHFTGMLALRLPVPLLFDWPIVLLSLLVAIAGSGTAFVIASRARVGWFRAIAAGIALGGVGISGLHFTAMEAMRLPGMRCYYRSWTLVTLSIVIAVVFSVIALPLTFRDPDGIRRSVRNHVSALLRGAANPAMHYTAMAALVFVSTSEVVDVSREVRASSLGILGISIVPVMLLIVALRTAVIDRLAKQTALLNELFEQAPQAVALLDRDGNVVRVNKEFTRLFGYSNEEMLEPGGIELIVPEQERREFRANLLAVEEGKRLDAEAVRQRKDGSRLHVHALGVPVAIPGGQFAIYAIYRDITERKKSEEAARTYQRRLVEAQEAERRRLARELHDEIGQLLTSAGMMLALSRQLPPDASEARVAEARSLLNDLIARVRNLALDLRPAILDDFGLMAALSTLFDRYTDQTGVRVAFEQGGLDGRRFDSEIETAAYRIVQEALTNVARHAQVGEATVRIRATEKTLTVEIEDRGAGFDPQLLRSGLSIGLNGMQERMAILAGHLIITTSPGKGTHIRAELPLR